MREVSNGSRLLQAGVRAPTVLPLPLLNFLRLMTPLRVRARPLYRSTFCAARGASEHVCMSRQISSDPSITETSFDSSQIRHSDRIFVCIPSCTLATSPSSEALQKEAAQQTQGRAALPRFFFLACVSGMPVAGTESIVSYSNYTRPAMLSGHHIRPAALERKGPPSFLVASGEKKAVRGRSRDGLVELSF